MLITPKRKPTPVISHSLLPVPPPPAAFPPALDNHGCSVCPYGFACFGLSRLPLPLTGTRTGLLLPTYHVPFASSHPLVLGLFQYWVSQGESGDSSSSPLTVLLPIPRPRAQCRASGALVPSLSLSYVLTKNKLRSFCCHGI